MPEKLAIASGLLPTPGHIGIALVTPETTDDPAQALLQQLIIDAALPFTQR